MALVFLAAARSCLHGPEPGICSDIDVPEWMVDHSGKRFSRSAPKCLHERAVPGLLSPRAPDYDGLARQVERVTARELTLEQLYYSFARRGIPIIIESLLTTDLLWFERKAQAIGQCCYDEYLAKHAQYGGVAPEGCDMYSNWCGPEAVQVCGKACRVLANYQPDTPGAARRLFERRQGLPSVEKIFERSQSPFVWFSKPGNLFGGPQHYDLACGPVMSSQFNGSKLWSLWAPWDVGNNTPAHTRFEAILRPGDVLIYPPSWFHGTVVLEGDWSLSSTFELNEVPLFGPGVDDSLRPHPFGFEACAGGSQACRWGWRENTRRWDRRLAPPPERDEL